MMLNRTVPGVVLSKPVDAPLHEMVARWSNAVARPCLCGGVIVAKVGDPGPGVREHQQRPQHRKWSNKVYPEQSTADTYAVDLSDMTSRASAAPGSKP